MVCVLNFSPPDCVLFDFHYLMLNRYFKSPSCLAGGWRGAKASLFFAKPIREWQKNEAKWEESWKVYFTIANWMERNVFLFLVQRRFFLGPPAYAFSLPTLCCLPLYVRLPETFLIRKAHLFLALNFPQKWWIYLMSTIFPTFLAFKRTNGVRERNKKAIIGHFSCLNHAF